MTDKDYRIRFAIARDQFDHELQWTFALAQRDSGYHPTIPTPRMEFWHKCMTSIQQEWSLGRI